MPGSSSALANITTRQVPCHDSWPSGSCSTTNRPSAICSPATTYLEAVEASVNGASRAGPGAGETVISGRARTRSTARATASKDALASAESRQEATLGA